MRIVGSVAVVLGLSALSQARADQPKPAPDALEQPAPAPAPATKLDDKNGFRDAKLGSHFASFSGLELADKRAGYAFYARKDDVGRLFGTPLARITYGFIEAKLARIVVAGAWTLHATTAKCEADTAYVSKQLATAFGKVSAVHGYSTPIGKQCIRDYAGGVDSPYCRVREWKGRAVSLRYYELATASPRPAPPGVVAPDGWTGYSCRFVLQYDKIIDPLEEL